MIYSLRGTLTVKEAGLAVIECAGVGYACRTTYNTLAALGNEGGEETLYTYMQVTQDGVSLFGFYSKAELRSFQMLLGVTGVGAKAALSILSDMDPNSFALAVATSNFKQLTKARGVGQKMAQRIVLELKDKISKEKLEPAGFAPSSGGGMTALRGGAASDAVEALLVLGYSDGEAEAAVAQLDPNLSAEELIRGALKSLAKFK
ncbi:MAG: Holliday junction branch migration protein RuvA [Oscillospiraceae bacterium]|nr:Holliday junction branch migration protein RuvA [Oscillospiraceae bacterium]